MWFRSRAHVVEKSCLSDWGFQRHRTGHRPALAGIFAFPHSFCKSFAPFFPRSICTLASPLASPTFSHSLSQRLGYAAVSWDIQAPADASVPYIHCDVSSEAKVAAALSQTVGTFGAPPSVLVNNCGLQYMAPVTEFPLEKWNTLLGIMVTGTFLCSKAVIPGSVFLVALERALVHPRCRHAEAELGPHCEHFLHPRQGSVALQERVSFPVSLSLRSLSNTALQLRDIEARCAGLVEGHGP